MCLEEAGSKGEWEYSKLTRSLGTDIIPVAIDESADFVLAVKIFSLVQNLKVVKRRQDDVQPVATCLETTHTKGLK